MKMSDALMNETSEAGRAGRNLRLQESQFLLSGQGPALVVSFNFRYIFEKIYNMSASNPYCYIRFIKGIVRPEKRGVSAGIYRTQ